MSTATTKLMTADELFELPDDNFRYDLVKGELRRMSPAGSEHGAIIINFSLLIAQHVKAYKLGIVFGAGTGFKLESDPNTVRAPDIAFVRRERVPASGVPRGFWQGAPDLAVEVVSPSDKLYEIDEKIDDYLAAGVSLVWVVYPKKRSVTVYSPGGEPHVLTVEDTIDAGEVITGLQCRIAEIFELS
ncbi:MAG: Uma2 family endonuclease [Pyrinomonadaceae bacterium]